MPGKARAVHQQLETELQSGIHLPASRLALAFFTTTLRIQIVIRHDDCSKFKKILDKIWGEKAKNGFAQNGFKKQVVEKWSKCDTTTWF